MLEAISWLCLFFFSSRRRHTRLQGDWSSDVCSSDLFNLFDMLVNDPVDDTDPDGRGWPNPGDPNLCGVNNVCPPFPEPIHPRSEERRVGKECRSRWSPYH